MEQTTSMYDIFIIGGGINGVGIARDAAGRGLKVGLCEKNDIGWATSSASSKLIHGGLRYLENYEFRLVRKALAEREVMLDIAPHLVRPLMFVLPHEPHLRPAWMIRCGLFMYDHLAKRSERLPGSAGFKFADKPDYADPLKKKYTKGFEYSDCQTDDSRLTLITAMDAARLGADVETRACCETLERKEDHWNITIRYANGTTKVVQSKILINAAGPWVEGIQQLIPGVEENSHLRLVKGSHIVVPKLYDGYHAYILQNSDNRIVFMTPYQDDFTMIGTTDLEYEGDPADVKIADEEVDYLLELINIYLEKEISKEDIVGSWSGVRPLYDDANGNASTITRDYVFDITGDNQSEAVLLSIFGGKITTYRCLAESAIHKLSPYLPKTSSWTGTKPLPGGDLPILPPENYVEDLCERYPAITKELMTRYVHTYGSLTETFLHGVTSIKDMGTHFGHGLYEAEVRYLMKEEWAKTPEDILWRRTKLGIHFTQAEKTALSEWLLLQHM
ncbi:MAG: glycerol-3-phosphate dehydrogenase [Alcaligenaceae bacterium]|nr:glycerol-3-phosphate dehydrogenase [Alcaligenaceae bacterium]